MEQTIKNLETSLNEVAKKEDITNIKYEQLKSDVDRAVTDLLSLRLELEKHRNDISTLHSYTKMREQHGSDITRLNSEMIKVNERLIGQMENISAIKSAIEKINNDISEIRTTVNEFPLKYEKITPSMTFMDIIKISPSFITVMIAIAVIIYYIIQHVGLLSK